METIDDYAEKPNYPQPHNIHLTDVPECWGNPALREHLTEKEHHRQKYKARQEVRYGKER